MKLFIGGKLSREEFHELERDVRTVADRTNAQIVTRERVNVDSDPGRFEDETFDDGAPSLRSLSEVDFFILCRSFPNEFTSSDVEAIRRVNPLAPIVLVAGALCEGEERTGERFVGVRRFYVETWRGEGRRELERFFDPTGSKGLFTKSPLASTVDLLVSSDVDECKESCSENVLILADDPDLGACLQDGFKERGCVASVESLVRFDPSAERAEKRTRVVVDTIDLSDPTFPERLTSIKRAFPGVPIVLLAFAPRVDETRYYERRDLWGKTRVVAKPFDWEDLLDEG